jgi:hypothetical protein
MKELKLTNSKTALVDDADFEKVSAIEWYSTHNNTNVFYARNKRIGYMHTYLIGSITGFDIDHIDRNGLNNQRSNLRHVSRTENILNQGKSLNNTSGFKGVYFRSKLGKFQALHKNKHLGLFETAEEAARAYDKTLIRLYGSLVWTNFPKNEYLISPPV